MNLCVEYEALLDLYVDGELEAEDMVRVQQHLDECPRCRAYADAAFAIRADFPDEETVPLPEGFHDRVMEAVRAESAKTARPRRSRYAMFAPLAAACLALMVAVSGGSAKKESDAPAVAQYSYSAADAESYAAPRAAAETAEEAPAAMEYTAAPAPALLSPEPAAAQGEADAALSDEAYFTCRSVSADEAAQYLAEFEAMEYNGAPAYELSAGEYAALLEALGIKEDIPAEGTALVTVQD